MHACVSVGGGGGGHPTLSLEESETMRAPSWQASYEHGLWSDRCCADATERAMQRWARALRHMPCTRMAATLRRHGTPLSL